MTFGNVIGYIASAIEELQFTDILDIAVVSVLTYIVIKFLRETRAAQFAKGILLIFVFGQIAKLIDLYATTYIFDLVFDFGIFALLIIFQPELRSMLERVGQKGFKGLSLIKTDDDRTLREAKATEMIDAITDATTSFAITKTGALMVIERETKLGDIINTGVVIDADPSSALIRNIFYPNTPLHDGAVIFRDFRVQAAGCFLPLSASHTSKDLGTRHHAALGMSEVSDAVVVVVSEETGIISVAVGGKLQRRITPDALSTLLKKYLIPDDEKRIEFLKKDFIMKEIFKKGQDGEEQASPEKKAKKSKRNSKKSKKDGENQ